MSPRKSRRVDHLARIEKAAKRVKDAQSQMDEARAELNSLIQAAYAAGETKSAIARALGVSRQRVQKMLDG